MPSRILRATITMAATLSAVLISTLLIAPAVHADTTPIAPQIEQEATVDTVDVVFGTTEDLVADLDAVSTSSRNKTRTAAENEAARFGMKIKWIPDNQGCGSVKTNVVGCYMPGNGPVVELPLLTRGMAPNDIRDIVRHEAAHHAISLMCGATGPSIIPSGRVEPVTNAYAAYYYGMNGRRDQFGPADTAVARKIHDQKICTKEQKTMTVVTDDAQLLVWYDNKDYIKHGAAVPLKKGATVTYYRTEIGFGWVKDSSGRKGFIHLSTLADKKSSPAPKPAQPSKPQPSKPAAPEKPRDTASGSVQVHRFWSPKFANAHFYTANASEAKGVRAGDKNWTYEGSSFRAYLPKNGTCQAGTTGIYRFWSAKFSSHFYTKNAGEMKTLRAKDPNWAYEGLVFCEPTSASGNTPVYRFWSPKYQKHFFTANSAEMQKLRSSDPSWTYEGIAWYAPKK